MDRIKEQKRRKYKSREHIHKVRCAGYEGFAAVAVLLPASAFRCALTSL
jgi:hypothetical protein